MNKQLDAKESLLHIVCRKMKFLAAVVFLCLLVILVLYITLPRTSSHPGQKAAATVTITSLGTALKLFRVDNGFFPPGSNGLIYLVQPPPGATNWRGPYLERSVTSDPWGHPYFYECPGRHNPQSYDLSATAPDGAPIVNWPQK